MDFSLFPERLYNVDRKLTRKSSLPWRSRRNSWSVSGMLNVHVRLKYNLLIKSCHIHMLYCWLKSDSKSTIFMLYWEHIRVYWEHISNTGSIFKSYAVTYNT